MAPPKRSKAKRSTTSAGAAEYRFRIDAFPRETMPMARLAEYMSRLAQLLGEPTYVARELAARLAFSDVLTVNKASANRRDRMRRSVFDAGLSATFRWNESWLQQAERTANAYTPDGNRE
jgi:hypothetical protein